MTERVQRFFAVQAEQDSDLGPRQVRLRASTEALGRDGLVVVTRGIDLGPYKSNPVMLWQHNRAEPVARAVDVSIQGGDLTVLAEFAAEGTSARADEICGLVKQGIVSGISAAFDIYETEPVDAKNRSAGRRVTKSELLEISFVAVPAERNSLVTERADGEDETDLVRIENPDDPDQFVMVRRPVTIESTEEREAEPAVERAGAKHSAATRAKMEDACRHAENMIRCLREMMDGDVEDRDMDEGGDEMRSAAMLGHPTPQELGGALERMRTASKSDEEIRSAAVELLASGEITPNQARSVLNNLPIPSGEPVPLSPVDKFRRQLALRSRAA